MSNEHEEKKLSSRLAENFVNVLTPDNIQKYIFGVKKNGHPRAIYDIVRDYTSKRVKKGKKKKDNYSFYLRAKKNKKKKKKHWHF